MKGVLLSVLVGMLVATVSVEGWAFGRVGSYVKDFYGGAKDAFDRVGSYGKDFYGGAKDMWRNYNDMKASNKEDNLIGADKYFHAKGNYEAANRGAGGRHAAALISNVREGLQLGKGIFSKTPWKEVVSDYKKDQEANKWGRNGGDPNKYRPKGLNEKYRK